MADEIETLPADPVAVEDVYIAQDENVTVIEMSISND